MYLAVIRTLIGLGTLLVASAAQANTCTSNKSGNWSSPSTWSGCSNPATGDTVVIASGHTVTLDAKTNTLLTLTITGTGMGSLRNDSARFVPANNWIFLGSVAFIERSLSVNLEK
jgi:hypothetical protein